MLGWTEARSGGSTDETPRSRREQDECQYVKYRHRDITYAASAQCNEHDIKRRQSLAQLVKGGEGK